MVLSFTFAFDIEEGEKYSFALAFPYSFSRIKAIEKRLADKNPEVVKVQPFAKSAVSYSTHYVFGYIFTKSILHLP